MRSNRAVLGVACLVPALVALQAASADRQQPAVSRASAPIVVPFELYRNAIWFEARVNGSRPLTFLFDTAAGTCVIDTTVADGLKLPILTEFDQPNAGSGDLPTHISIRPAVTLEVAGVSLEFPQIAALSHDDVSRSYGRRIEGIIGYPLMARYVVDIDFDARRLVLHEPATFAYTGPGASLPLEIPADRREPVVRARIAFPGKEPIEGRFLVDEPHPHCLLFATPFSRAHELPGLAATMTKRLLPGSAMGVGGKTPYTVGRVGQFQLGPFTFKALPAAFADSRGGAFARTDIAGIIGGEILRRFRVVMDIPHKRMILERGKAFEESFDWDASGLKLRGTGADFREVEVIDVVPDSPAADAGIAVGDCITAIDGRPTSQLTLWDVELLFRKAGRSYTLTVNRAGQARTVVIRTRQLI